MFHTGISIGHDYLKSRHLMRNMCPWTVSDGDISPAHRNKLRPCIVFCSTRLSLEAGPPFPLVGYWGYAWIIFTITIKPLTTRRVDPSTVFITRLRHVLLHQRHIYLTTDHSGSAGSRLVNKTSCVCCQGSVPADPAHFAQTASQIIVVLFVPDLPAVEI